MTLGLKNGILLEGRYRIYNRIGEGGMGVVYAAEHVALHRKCAVKVLHPSEANDELMIARFKIEAQASANIRHPNIVEVMDFGITPDKRPFFVMEYVEGESLADRINKKGMLQEREAAAIAIEILGGLCAAHRLRVVHRDLKPENIYLAKIDRKTEMVKILDFGISKIVAGTPSMPPAPISGNHQALTRKGIVYGTPGYMAPETLFGTESIDHRADLFSVAVMIYEMLTGKRPFRGKDAQSIMLATAAQNPTKIRDLRPEISSVMENIVERGLKKDPMTRFQSAEEFQNSLLKATRRGLVSRFSKPPLPPNPPKHLIQKDEKPAPQKPVKQAAVVLTKQIKKTDAVTNDKKGNYVEQNRSNLFRKLTVYFAPIPILFFVGLGYGIYHYFVKQKPVLEVRNEDPIDERIENWKKYGTIPAKEDKYDRSVLETVVINVESKPEKISIFVNDKEVFERPLIIPKHPKKTIELRFSSQEYQDEIRQIVPDQDQTIWVRLVKLETKKKR